MTHEFRVILLIEITFKMTLVILSLTEKACLLTRDSSHDSNSSIHYPDVAVLHVHPQAAQRLEELAVRLAEESPGRLHRVGVDERVDVLEFYKFVAGRGHS